MIDLVFPTRNELEFIRMAEKLNYSTLCFVYDYKKDIWQAKKTINEEQKKTKIKLYFGLLAEPKDVSRARKDAELVLVKATGNDQTIFEKIKPDIVFDLELTVNKDPLRFRLSGLNQVLCKFAAKNKVIVGFSFSSILNSKNRIHILGRIMQNIRLCRKYKVETAFCSFAKNTFEMRQWHDLMSLLVVLGMEQGKAKLSLKTAEERIKLNMKKKSPDYLGEGIEIIK